MKQLLSFLILTLSFQAQAQQSQISGLVAVFNSQFDTGKRQYVANASVEEDFGKSHAALTKADGSFHLPLIGIKDQEKVFYSVKKEGFEIVNVDALQAVAGQAEALRVYMASEGKIAENKLKYYKINRIAAEKALTDKLDSLEREMTAAKNDQSRLKKLQEDYSLLQAQFEKLDDTARELADRYAKTNLDDVSADYQRAFRCFQRGALDSALIIFRAADLENKADFIISEQSRTNKLRDEYARRDSDKNKRKRETNDALVFKAQLLQTKFEFDRVQETYELLLRLDSSNVDNLAAFADFLATQNQTQMAIEYYEKCIRLPQSQEIYGKNCNDLARSYYNTQKLSEADTMYHRALNIFKQLAQNDPMRFESDVALIENNLGMYYERINKKPEAETRYLRSMEILERFAKINPVDFEPRLATTAINLGAYYFTINKIQDAEKAFLRSMEIRERLAKNNPMRFEADLATILMNLGNFYYAVQNRPKAESMYQRSLEIRERLVINNPARYEPDLAATAMNLGNYYQIIQNLPEAEALYQRSLEIRERLVKNNPAQFESDLAMTAMNLGILFYADQKMPEAEKAFLRSLEIRERLAKNAPTQFEGDLATTLMNLGVLYQTIPKMPEAESMYLRSLAIYERLEKGNSEQFGLDFAMILMNLGDFYDLNQEASKAEDFYLRSIDAWGNLAKSNPVEFEWYLSYAKRGFGAFCIKQGKLLAAKQQLSGSLSLWQKLVKGGMPQFTEYLNQTLDSYRILRDSFAVRKDYSAVVSIQLERAICMDSLKNFDPSFKAYASFEYDSLAKFCLYDRQFVLAEKSARRALEINTADASFMTNLANALLLQGKKRDAKQVFQSMALQICQQNPSKRYRDVFLEEVEALRVSGIASKRDYKQVKAWVR